MNLCECGCGNEVSIATYTIRSKGIIKGKPLRFVNGHTSRIINARLRAESMPSVNPTGLCMCGCGLSAPLSMVTRYERGQVRGQPVRFINGHNSHKHREDARIRISDALRTRVPSEETRRRLSESKTGPKNPAWRGGRTTRRKRVQVYVGKTHPMASAHGYVLEHRLTMAAVLGRMLGPKEHVHHIDLDTLNNSPENLVILSPSEHSRLHRLIDWHAIPPRVALDRILSEAAA